MPSITNRSTAAALNSRGREEAPGVWPGVVSGEPLPERRARGHCQTFPDYVFAGSPARDWVALANQIFEARYKEMMKPSEGYVMPPATPAPPSNAAYARRLSRRLCRRRQDRGFGRRHDQDLNDYGVGRWHASAGGRSAPINGAAVAPRSSTIGSCHA